MSALASAALGVGSHGQLERGVHVDQLGELYPSRTVARTTLWKGGVMRKVLWVAIVLIFCGLSFAGPAAGQEGSLDGKVICLDPGHGGSDPGAVYDRDDLYLEEADINLDVARALAAMLEENGAQVVLTRSGDSYVSNSERYLAANNANADILVSIHTNSVLRNADTVDGSMALYFKREDKPLAQAVYGVMYEQLALTAPIDVAFRDFGLEKFANRVLMSSEMPATTMEPLCMSHPAEAALLSVPVYDELGAQCSECRRLQIAQAICDGIVSYFSAPVNDDGPGRGPAR